MHDLALWLTAQLDEDERIARAATAGPWRAHDTHLGQYGYAATVLSGEGNDTDLRAWLPSMSNEPWDEARNVWADAAFIAEHDPARVLREVDSKRRTMELHRPIPDPTPPFKDVDGFLCSVCTSGERLYDQNRGVLFTDLTVFPCQTLRLLVLPYADREGYRPEWAPSE